MLQQCDLRCGDNGFGRVNMDEWFEVNKKNPPENTPILTYEKYDIGFGISIFKEGKFLLISDTGYFSLIIRPTHWAFLPDPPKEV